MINGDLVNLGGGGQTVTINLSSASTQGLLQAMMEFLQLAAQTPGENVHHRSNYGATSADMTAILNALDSGAFVRIVPDSNVVNNVPTMYASGYISNAVVYTNLCGRYVDSDSGYIFDSSQSILLSANGTTDTYGFTFVTTPD